MPGDLGAETPAAEDEDEGFFEEVFEFGDEEEEDEGRTREELIEEITTLIKDTVDPDSWRDNGGSVGSIRELSGQLIVTQTPKNQREVVSLLEGLRETRAIQVTVEEVETSANRIREAMELQAQTVTMITAAVDETALAADSMSSTIAAIRSDTENVAKDIDQVEHGFGRFSEQIADFKSTTKEFVAGIAA